jgi:hypothetical protein
VIMNCDETNAFAVRISSSIIPSRWTWLDKTYLSNFASRKIYEQSSVGKNERNVTGVYSNEFQQQMHVLDGLLTDLDPQMTDSMCYRLQRFLIRIPLFYPRKSIRRTSILSETPSRVSLPLFIGPALLCLATLKDYDHSPRRDLSSAPRSPKRRKNKARGHSRWGVTQPHLAPLGAGENVALCGMRRDVKYLCRISAPTSSRPRRDAHRRQITSRLRRLPDCQLRKSDGRHSSPARARRR